MRMPFFAEKTIFKQAAGIAVSKALPTIHLGGRKAEDGYATLHNFAQRLAPDCIPAITTDGLRTYFSSITAQPTSMASCHFPSSTRGSRLDGKMVSPSSSRM